MTVNPQRLAKLQEHGLTEYEGRAYLALLDLGTAEASQVADLSRVPRTKIYQALDGLETKRLLRVIPERPKRYCVESFEGYLDTVAKDLESKAGELKAQRTELAAEFAPKNTVTMEAAGGFITVKGRSTIASKLCEMMGRAERSLHVATSENGAHRLAYHADILAEAADRGTDITVHCPVTHENADAVTALDAHGTVREAATDLGSTTFVFVDDAEVMVIHHVPDDRHHFQGSDVALWSDDPGVVGALKATLHLAWTSATPLTLDRLHGKADELAEVPA